MYYWFQLFEQHGITDVLINLNYLPDQVRSFVDRQDFELNVELFYEEQLLGSAGTLRACRNFVNNEESFLICYADNLTNMNLTDLITQHKNTHPLLTIGLFKTDKPTECGIVELDEHKNVISFIEKPQKPVSNLAGAGIYVASQDVLNYIDGDNPVDIGYHLLPKLVGNMKGYLIRDYFLDIGSPQNYEKATMDWNL